MTVRGQSSVVGVAILLAVTVTAMALVTAGTGSILDGAVGGVQSERVADQFVSEFPGSSALESRDGDFRIRNGAVELVDRELRLLQGNGTVFERNVGAFVYRNGEHRVAAHAGAVVTGTESGAQFRDSPATALTTGNGSQAVYLLVPVFTSGSSHGFERSAGVGISVETTVDSVTVGASDRVAVETTSIAPWERWFTRRNLSTATRDLDGDGIDSVVATFSTDRTVHLVIVETEVGLHG